MDFDYDLDAKERDLQIGVVFPASPIGPTCCYTKLPLKFYVKAASNVRGV